MKRTERDHSSRERTKENLYSARQHGGKRKPDLYKELQIFLIFSFINVNAQCLFLYVPNIQSKENSTLYNT